MDVQLRILEEKLQIAEEEYRRFAIDERDLDEEAVAAKINQARLAPQTNRRLQRIHKAHEALIKMTSKSKVDTACYDYTVGFALHMSPVILSARLTM